VGEKKEERFRHPSSGFREGLAVAGDGGVSLAFELRVWQKNRTTVAISKLGRL